MGFIERALIWVSLLTLVCGLTGKKPNIVFILTDDQDVTMGGMVCEPSTPYPPPHHNSEKMFVKHLIQVGLAELPTLPDSAEFPENKPIICPMF